MTKIVVAQGMCTPIRNNILTAIKPYGVKVLALDSYSVGEDGARGRDGAGYINNKPARYNVGELEVTPQAARWVEYLLLRSENEFKLLSKPVDPRNIAWAAKWDTLPPAWKQQGCKLPQNKQQQSQQPRHAAKTKKQKSIIQVIKRIFE